jgi:hypothetical protein
MAARGYPIEEFEARAADLSVHHPRVVETTASHAPSPRGATKPPRKSCARQS